LSCPSLSFPRTWSFPDRGGKSLIEASRSFGREIRPCAHRRLNSKGVPVSDLLHRNGWAEKIGMAGRNRSGSEAGVAWNTRSAQKLLDVETGLSPCENLPCFQVETILQGLNRFVPDASDCLSSLKVKTNLDKNKYLRLQRCPVPTLSLNSSRESCRP
jgi:hypothetical protein